MAKYNVGDKVRVREGLTLWYHNYPMENSNHHGWCVVPIMSDFCGKVVTIREFNAEQNCYFIEEIPDGIRWTDGMFEGLVEDEKKMFTKRDLKTGMFGVMSSIGQFVVIANRIIYRDGGFDIIDGMNDKLEYVHYRVEKVYKNCMSFEALENKINSNSTDGLVFDRESDEKLYNGKVICIDNINNPDLYTPGKIYQFVEGVVIVDDGGKFGDGYPFHTFEDWERFTSSKFIEVVE